MKKLFKYFSIGELILWCSSVTVIVISFCLFDRESYLTLVASLVGVTALIFCAKGNPIGQVLMVLFSILYGIISLGFAYYGEMITYLGMSMPMAIFSLISWVRNPYKGDHSVVKTNKIEKKEIFIMLGVSAIVTVIFYFILKIFGTANLLPSTLSVSSSFLAAYLTFRRSPYFALVYAINDIVLIVLWTLAAFRDATYISVIICFAVFLVNDLHGFFSWKRMEIRQSMPIEP